MTSPVGVELVTLNGVYTAGGKWVAIYSATVTLAAPAGRTTRIRHVPLDIDATVPARAEAIADSATRPSWAGTQAARP